MGNVRIDTFARLMDTAYDRFPKGRSYIEFFASLSGFERMAVAIGNLNYQVENGGWVQWIDNRYGEASGRSAIEALRIIGGPSCLIVADMAERVLALVADTCDEDYEDDEDDEDSGNTSDPLDALSTDYYGLNADMLAEAEAFFARHAGVAR